MPDLLKSPAKINLGLSIVGRRSDGFHLLESLFWPISFGDSIELSPGQMDLSMVWHADAPFKLQLPAKEENVAWKLFSAIQKFSTIQLKCEIKKCIPMGGGLGGGSSNAGSLLKYLVSQYKLKIPDLYEWSCQFGADIPFFLDAKPSWVTGVGEKLRPITLADDLKDRLHFLLVLFPFGCNTREVFTLYKNNQIGFSPSLSDFHADNLNLSTFKSYLSSTKNDLEPLATKLHPTIGEVLNQLRGSDCLLASLSGSGSTCFAVFESNDARERKIKALDTFFRKIGCRIIKAETFTTR